MHERQEASRRLLVARADGAKALERVKEHFDQVALPVHAALEPSPVVLARGVVADDWLHAVCAHGSDEAVRVVRGVSEQIATARVSEKLLSERRLVLLAGRQSDMKRPRLSIDNGVDLR